MKKTLVNIFSKYLISTLFFVILFTLQINIPATELPDSVSNKLSTLNDEEKVDYLSELCWSMREKQPDYALMLGNKAMNLADSLGLLSKYGKANNYTGVILIHYKYKTKEAVPYFHKTLEIALKLNDSLSVGFAYNNLGDVYYLTGNAPLALDYANRSMQYMEGINDSLGMAYTHINFGLVYRFEKKYNLALEHFNKAILIRDKIGFKLGIASALHEIGLVYFEMGNYEKSLEFYREAYRLNKEINNKRWMAFSLNGMGEVYYATGKYDEALKRFNESLALNKERSHNYGIISNKIGKALVYSKTNQNKYGKKELGEALALAEELGVPTKLLETYKAIASFYLNINDFESASKSFNSFLSIYDSLYFAQQFETFSELQNSFAIKQRLEESERVLFNKKQEEIYLIVIVILLVFLILVLLWKYRSNQLLNNQLKLLIDTKDKLFSIISHDLRNPFFALMGYIDLLKDKDLDKEDRLEIIDNLDQVTDNTYSLLENLLNLSASKRGDIKFEPVIFSLTELIAQIKISTEGQLRSKSIILSTEIVEDSIYADRNMLEIVLRNLISNAIKYCKKNGTVKISSRKETKGVLISVLDDGIGMTQDVLDSLFKSDFMQSRKGTAGEKGTGLGLSLCKEFINYHEGTIVANSQYGAGSEFQIFLPSK